MPTATAEHSAARRQWLLAVAALSLVAAIGVVVGIRAQHTTERAEAEPVAVRSIEGPRYANLRALVGASDVVVVGTVREVQRGRAFGGADGVALVSRIVLLDVDGVLEGTLPGRRILIEEEGWLADGTPLIVDDLEPTRVGDFGVWFLVRSGAADDDTWVLASTQGRFVDRDGQLHGGDPTVSAIQGTSLTSLIAQIIALS